MSVHTEKQGPIFTVTLDRPHRRNAIDGQTAQLLAAAFRSFEADKDLRVAILYGHGGHFCSGADLKAVAQGVGQSRIHPTGDSPMGPARLALSKPVIAAIEGFAVAGGLELAVWCDLRVAAEDATFGVFSRRWGVPLMDGGTFRLPRLIGQSRAMDMILTGRAVPAPEAEQWGLVNRLVAPGTALKCAENLAQQLAQFPQLCLRGDRMSVMEQWSLSEEQALTGEFKGALGALEREARAGANLFAKGAGRHGEFEFEPPKDQE